MHRARNTRVKKGRNLFKMRRKNEESVKKGKKNMKNEGKRGKRRKEEQELKMNGKAKNSKRRNEIKYSKRTKIISIKNVKIHLRANS